MIDTKALRNKILDLAISGKLTEQLPEDGNAEDLYARIQEEKAKLIADGKIKKEKPLPPITEEEIPFDIPENWKWVRVSDIIKNDVGGGTPRKDTADYWENGNIPWMTVKDFSSSRNGYINDTIDHITELGLDKSATNMVDEDALIICMRMALGKIVRPTVKMAINQDLRAIWLLSGIFNDYFYYYYATLNVTGHGMTVSGINRSELMMSLIPLPPFSEQKRIVSAVEDAFAVIDRIEKAQESYYADQEVLKNKIIDAGIRGKLTEQLLEDGNAEDLYVQIQAGKAKLIADGIIRKEKSVPPISEEEIPFDIPKNWKLVRLGDLIRIISGTSYSKTDVQQTGIRILRGGNICNSSIKYEESDVFLPESYFDEDKCIREKDAVIVASTGSETAIGRAGICKWDDPNAQIGAFLRIIRTYDLRISDYINYYFLTDNYKSHIRDRAKGTNINNIKEIYITEIAFPLPPLAEQKRIVGIIEKTINCMSLIKHGNV